MPSTSNTSRSTGLVRLFGYGAGGLASTLATIPASMLLLYFLTEFVHLEPWLAGLVLALPKLWDVVVDMPIGRYADQFAQRAHGRLRVGMWSALALVVFLPLSFYHPALASTPLLATYYVVVQILQATAYTLFGVTYLALAGDLAVDAAERNRLLTVYTFGSNLAAIALILCVPFMIRIGGSGEQGYFSMNVMVALIMALMFIWFYGAVRNTPAQSTELSEVRVEMPLHKGIAAILHNRAFLAIIVVTIAVGTGTGALNALLPYENQYLLGRPAEALFLLIGPILVGTFAGLPLASPMLRRFNSTRTLRISLLGLTILSILYWFGLLYDSIPLIVVSGTLCGIFNAILNVSMPAAALDTAQSVEGPSLGLYLGMFMSAQKLGLSLGGVVSGGLLSLINYHADAPVSPALRHGIAFAGLVGPLAPFVIAWLASLIYGAYTPESAANHQIAPSADTI